MHSLPQNLLLSVGLSLALPSIITHWLELPAPAAAGLFISIVFLWFSELIPLAVTALMVPVLALAYGLMDAKGAFSAFGDSILFLFLGSFFLARAMEKHGWDKRMAYTVLAQPFTSVSIERLSTVIALICWVLSMWISNTATCAIMTPMVLSIINTLRQQIESEQEKSNLSSRLLLITAFASSIGGMATPVGSPPNLIALALLRQHGIDISFAQWMGYGVPISLIMLVALLILLRWRLPIRTSHMQGVAQLFKDKLLQLGPIKRSEYWIVLAFSAAVLGWIAPDVLKYLKFSDSIAARFNMGAVSLACALFLFLVKDEHKSPVLSWEDSRHIQWGVIMLFGGGLCLGKILDSSQLAGHISHFIFSGLDAQSFSLIIITVILAVILSEFSSNTAAAAILVPILLAQTIAADASFISATIVAVALGASCGFMLPVSTPPNAIVYGTGELPLKHMIRYGLMFDIIGVLSIVALLAFRI